MGSVAVSVSQIRKVKRGRDLTKIEVLQAAAQQLRQDFSSIQAGTFPGAKHQPALQLWSDPRAFPTLLPLPWAQARSPQGRCVCSVASVVPDSVPDSVCRPDSVCEPDAVCASPWTVAC